MLLALCWNGSVSAQTTWPGGFPNVTALTNRGDYLGSAQSNQVAQDSRGVMYFGNPVHGVQIFHGNGWQPLSIRGNANPIALEWHPTHARLYVGGHDYFGYVAAGPQFTYQFTDLSDAHEIPDFRLTRIEDFIPWGDSLILRLETRLLLWDGSRLAPLFSSERYIYSVNVTGEAFWVFVREDGLFRGDAAGVRPVPYPAELRPILHLHEEDDGTIVALNRSGEIWALSEADGMPHWTVRHRPALPLPLSTELTRAIRLQDGSYAASSANDGVLFLHADGTLRYALTTAHGLSANTVTYLFEDTDGHVWASSSSGLSVIEYRTPMRVLTGAQAVPGQVSGLTAHRGELYAAAEEVWHWRADLGRWNVISAGTGSVTNLRSDGTHLWALTPNGLFELQSGRMVKVYGSSMYDVQPSSHYPGVLYGLNGGPWFKLFARRADGSVERRILQRNLETRLVTLHEDENGGIWIGTGAGVLFMDGLVRDENGEWAPGPITPMGEAEGLPPGNYNFTTQVNGEVLFITAEGTYAFDATSRRFVPHASFANAFQEREKRTWPLVQDGHNRVWLALTGLRLGYLDLLSPPPHTWNARLFRRHGPMGNVMAFVVPSREVAYTAATYGISRFLLDRAADLPAPSHALLRSVHYAADSLLSAGAAPRQHTHATALAWTPQPMVFVWGSTSHLPARFRWFQTRLEGYEDDWSERTQDTRREFTNLAPGRYTFRVRAIDLYDQSGEEATFSFVIAPPWYASPWAYAAYALLLFGGIVGVVYLRTATLQRQKRHLEDTVRARTSEIEQARLRAEEDKRTIEAQNQTIREAEAMKDRLFANISHEFRTPITVSFGLAEELEHALRTGTVARPEDAATIKRNLRRLNQMMEQILDLTRFDHNAMVLKQEVVRLSPLVRRIGMSFQSLAASRNQFYFVDVPELPACAVTDPDKLETILNNLIHNALKYTPTEGTVRISAREEGDAYVVRVEDTGPGIEEALHEAVFSRFYRVQNAKLPYQEGLGLGLELSRTLARAMGGDVEIEAGRPKGTAFRFHIPLTATAAIPHETLEAEEQTPLQATPVEAEVAPPTDLPAQQDILLVEDNPDMRAYITSILKVLGTIRTASDGVEALEHMRERKPDLVVADLMMPRMDGIALTQQMSADPDLKHIPILVVSARALEEDKLHVLRLGVADYIAKPFHKEELLLRAANALRLYQSRRLNVQVTSAAEAAQEKGVIDRAAQYILSHLEEEDITGDHVAKAVHMSRSSLYRVLKAETGLAFGAFVLEVRMRYARQLLTENPNLTLDALSRKVGFEKTSWFVRKFTEHYGFKPQDFKHRL